MKVIQNRDKCIGCGACEQCAPKFWQMSDDGKATLKGSKEVKGKYVREINKDEVAENQEAADTCPVGAIEVEK